MMRKTAAVLLVFAVSLLVGVATLSAALPA